MGFFFVSYEIKHKSAVFHYLTCNSTECNMQLKLWGLYEGGGLDEKARCYSVRWVCLCTLNADVWLWSMSLKELPWYNSSFQLCPQAAVSNTWITLLFNQFKAQCEARERNEVGQPIQEDAQIDGTRPYFPLTVGLWERKLRFKQRALQTENAWGQYEHQLCPKAWDKDAWAQRQPGNNSAQ